MCYFFRLAIKYFITNRMEDEPNECVVIRGDGGRADIWAPTWADVVGVEIWQNADGGWQVDFIGEGLIQFEPTPAQWEQIRAFDIS